MAGNKIHSTINLLYSAKPDDSSQKNKIKNEIEKETATIVEATENPVNNNTMVCLCVAAQWLSLIRRLYL